MFAWLPVPRYHSERHMCRISDWLRVRDHFMHSALHSACVSAHCAEAHDLHHPVILFQSGRLMPHIGSYRVARKWRACPMRYFETSRKAGTIMFSG